MDQNRSWEFALSGPHLGLICDPDKERTMGSPAVSVVVCTRDRCDKLRRCLQALLAIKTAHDWELIIVDSSRDGTGELLASLRQDGANPRIKTIYYAALGLGAARNAGWRAADADIIAFTDDDCYVAPDHIDAVIAAFEKDVGFVGGRVLLHDPEDLPQTITLLDDYVRFAPRSYIDGGEIIGANMMFRRAVLEQIGGFDERFGASTKLCAGEDIDAMARALWAGIAGAFDPSIVVRHHHGRKSVEALRKLMHVYDCGRGAYHAKFILHPPSRATYLYHYARHIYGGFRYADSWRTRRIMVGRSAREFVGGVRYVRTALKKVFDRERVFDASAQVS
jgi:glycosyltransferase involved in cell wall biosynthesis